MRIGTPSGRDGPGGASRPRGWCRPGSFQQIRKEKGKETVRSLGMGVWGLEIQGKKKTEWRWRGGGGEVVEWTERSGVKSW